MGSNEFVLAIVGPTASGKTALALELAKHSPIEIISLDSALVYRDMNIGTAKPSAADRAAVPHHLIDIRNPNESYSAAEFVADAARLISEIRERGAAPVMVGGTMMYLRALSQGLDDLPKADQAVRQRLEQDGLEYGWPALHARLQTVDPVSARRLAPNDSQRIQRALEVWELTGQPMSGFFQNGTVHSGNALNLHTVSLEPTDRSILHARIAERFDLMLERGFLDEVKLLRAHYELKLSMPSVRCVGYRQAWDYLDGACSYDQFRQAGIAATRQLAKRQLTWLRGMHNRVVFDPFVSEGLMQALAHCSDLLMTWRQMPPQ